ncbi:MAG: hypothetical protein PGN09_07275 [Sphingomonas fennica]
MRLIALPAAALLLSLAACGRQTPAENKADQLDQAARESDPAAAPVLENAADALRDGNAVDPQAALAEGGMAQAGTAPPTASGLGGAADDTLVANRSAAPR